MMLTRFRIEVEEPTAAACVEALQKYQHALQAMEADRYRMQWPVTLTAEPQDSSKPTKEIDSRPAAELEYPTECYWDMPMEERCFFNEDFGTEVTEEIIEYDASIPGYKGRRVVRLTRFDTRRDTFHVMIKPYIEWQVTSAASPTQNSGTSS